MPERDLPAVRARVVDSILLALAGLTFVAAIARVVVPEIKSPMLLLTGLTPWTFVIAFPLAIVCALRRQWIALALSVIVAIAYVGWMTPEVLHRRPVPKGARIHVATANLYAYNQHPERIVPALEKVDADVLVVEELTPRAVDAFRRAGLFARYPHRFLRPLGDPQGIGMFSKLPLERPRAIPLASATGLGATIVVDGKAVDVYGMHTHAPFEGGRPMWRAEFAAARERLATGRGRAIVVGDFNATMQFPTLRRFARHAHLVEAHQARGRGFASTWPANRPFPPLMRLDHVFVRGLGVAHAGEFGVPGSDHRGVATVLVVPGAVPSA